MEAPLGVLLRILTTNPRPKELQGMTYLVVRRPYAHLEEELLRAAAELGEVHVLVDRRHGERRIIQEPVVTQRRHGDRRRDKDEVVEIVVLRRRR